LIIKKNRKYPWVPVSDPEILDPKLLVIENPVNILRVLVSESKVLDPKLLITEKPANILGVVPVPGPKVLIINRKFSRSSTGTGL
jgi:hypothetical protein